jgi:hypothetical protein
VYYKILDFSFGHQQNYTNSRNFREILNWMSSSLIYLWFRRIYDRIYHYLSWMFQSAQHVFFFLVFLSNVYRQYWSLPSRKVFFSEAGVDWIGAMTQARTSAQPSAGLAGGHKQLLHEEQDLYRPWPFALLSSRNLTWSLVFHSQPKPGIFFLGISTFSSDRTIGYWKESPLIFTRGRTMMIESLNTMLNWSNSIAKLHGSWPAETDDVITKVIWVTFHALANTSSSQCVILGPRHQLFNFFFSRTCLARILQDTSWLYATN